MFADLLIKWKVYADHLSMSQCNQHMNLLCGLKHNKGWVSGSYRTDVQQMIQKPPETANNEQRKRSLVLYLVKKHKF